MSIFEYILSLDPDQLSRVSSFSQVATGLLTLLTIFVSVIIFLTQKVRDQKKQAVKAGVETEQILVQIAFIDSVFKTVYPDEYETLMAADKSKMKYFEDFEIDLVYSEREMHAIRKMFEDNTYNTTRIGGPALFFVIKPEQLTQENSAKLFELANQFKSMRLRITDADPEEDYTFLLHRVIVDTLNKMETLGMMMRKKIADEKTVYVSAGDKFIEFIGAMYYYIASTNRVSELLYHNGYVAPNMNRKKMKNVIWIFNRWSRRTYRHGRYQRRLGPILHKAAQTRLCRKRFSNWSKRWTSNDDKQNPTC